MFFMVKNHSLNYAFFACIYVLLNKNIINGLSDLLCFDVKENGSFRCVHWEFPSLCAGCPWKSLDSEQNQRGTKEFFNLMCEDFLPFHSFLFLGYCDAVLARL